LASLFKKRVMPVACVRLPLSSSHIPEKDLQLIHGFAAPLLRFFFETFGKPLYGCAASLSRSYSPKKKKNFRRCAWLCACFHFFPLLLSSAAKTIYKCYHVSKINSSIMLVLLLGGLFSSSVIKVIGRGVLGSIQLSILKYNYRRLHELRCFGNKKQESPLFMLLFSKTKS
jgi:hypothetical protein